MFWTQIFDLILSSGVLLLQICIIVIIALALFAKKSKVYLWLGKYSIHLAFTLALSGIIGSLTYSEIIGLQACTFCWWQRVFIYPQVLILGMALLKNEGAIIKKYALALSSIGMLFATYHILIQKVAVIATTVNCDATGAVSCTNSYLNVFGYITIPVMSGTILLCIILLLSIKNNSRPL